MLDLSKLGDLPYPRRTRHYIMYMPRTHLEALPPLKRDERVGEDAIWLVQIQVHLARNEIEAVEIRLEPGHCVRSRYRSVRSRRSRARFRQLFVLLTETNDVA